MRKSENFILHILVAIFIVNSSVHIGVSER